MLPSYELYTDLDVDTAVAIARDYACDVRECVFSKKYTFVVMFGTIWGSVHLPCHGVASLDDFCLMLSENGTCCRQSSSSSPHFKNGYWM